MNVIVLCSLDQYDKHQELFAKKMSLTKSHDSKIDRLLRWRRGETPGPWEITIFPTNRCNQRCNICWQVWAEKEFGKVDYASELSDERLLRLVDEAADLGVKEWAISGGGDPLVRGPLVMGMCERIVERGMTGELFTNGTLLKQDYLEHLIRIGWKRIGISLDGPNAETNDAVRWEGSFEKATANLRLLAELKKKARKEAPIVAVHAVLTSLLFDRLEPMVELVHNLDGKDLGLGHLLTYPGTNAHLKLTDEQRAHLPERLRHARQLADSYGISTNLEELIPREGPSTPKNPSDDIAQGTGYFAHASCFEPWLSMAIIAEGGRVGPCCVFWEKEGEADSIRDLSLKEVWTGPYIQEVRRRIQVGKNLPTYCSGCHSFIAARTQSLRVGLRARTDETWARLGPAGRVLSLAKRLAANMRNRGIRQTFRRAREWIQLHYG